MGSWRRLAAVGAAVACAAGLAAGESPDADRLRFLAVGGDGAEIAAQQADDPVNPASVVKVGTTLWALDTYGADHRFDTVFGVLGTLDRTTGELDGDLVVTGGGDPDFQWENLFLVARELNRLGLTRVRGRVRIQRTFWFGWENGVETRLVEPAARGERMGRRLIAALDPDRWDASLENTWRALCKRRGWKVSERPRVVVNGGVRVSDVGDATPLVVHRSNPLPDTLRRFNVYSNNDIVRIADGLGTVAELQAFLLERLDLEEGELELATASGEHRNRMSVRRMVDLMVELRAEAVEHELELHEILPLIGCDPGATRRMFPALAAPPLTGAVTCKTGTLTKTDGGVAVLAGIFEGAGNGPVVFAVAAPRAGGRLQHWRQVQQRWLLSLIDDRGGAKVRPCGQPVPFSDTFAEVESLVGGE